MCMVPSTALLLRRTHSLTELYLARCNLSEDGACQLAEALRDNSTLRVLWLWGNPLGERGAKALVESLAHNTSVKDLCIPHQYKDMISNSVVYGRVNVFCAYSVSYIGLCILSYIGFIVCCLGSN